MKLILRLYHELHSRIERHLVAQVKAAGGTAYKFTSSGRRNVPDRLVLLLGGRVVFVECTATARSGARAQQASRAGLRGGDFGQ